MKKLLTLSLLLAGFIIAPSIASAKPHHDRGIPPKCVDGRGHLKCDKHDCRKYCDDYDDRWDDRHYNDRRPAVIIDRPHPMPSSVEVRTEIEIQRLAEDNDHLGRELERARREAEHEYRVCLRNMPYAMRSYCGYDNRRINDIQRQIDENRRKIEHLKHIQRRY